VDFSSFSPYITKDDGIILPIEAMLTTTTFNITKVIFPN
jgi:hypothetical protein